MILFFIFIYFIIYDDAVWLPYFECGRTAENNFNQWLVHSKNSPPPVLDRSSLGVYILNLLRQFTLIKFVFLIIWPATANAVFYHVIMLLLFIFWMYTKFLEWNKK